MNVERYTRPDGLDVVRATACRAGVDTVPAKVETVEITEDLYAALAHALPGGVLDALLGSDGVSASFAAAGGSAECRRGDQVSVWIEGKPDGSSVARATVCRADMGAQPAKSATIEITEPIADHGPQDKGLSEPMPQWEQRYRDFYQRQAEDIHAALAHALPGGTLDALFAVMARDRASVLRVLKPPVSPSGG